MVQCASCLTPHTGLHAGLCPPCFNDHARDHRATEAPKRAVQRGIAERWEANLNPDRAPFTPAELTS
jgi:hypothetical protein